MHGARQACDCVGPLHGAGWGGTCSLPCCFPPHCPCASMGHMLLECSDLTQLLLMRPPAFADCKNKHLAYWGPLFATVGLVGPAYCPFVGPSHNSAVRLDWGFVPACAAALRCPHPCARSSHTQHVHSPTNLHLPLHILLHPYPYPHNPHLPTCSCTWVPPSQGPA